MIDDITLAAWEQNHHHVDMWGNELEYEPASGAACVICKAIIEIRRLREVHDQGVRRFREMEAERDAARTDRDLLRYVQKDLDADLAAHRAVVTAAEHAVIYLEQVLKHISATHSPEYIFRELREALVVGARKGS